MPERNLCDVRNNHGGATEQEKHARTRVVGVYARSMRERSKCMISNKHCEVAGGVIISCADDAFGVRNHCCFQITHSCHPVKSNKQDRHQIEN